MAIVAGQRLTADALNAFTPKVVDKTSSETRTSTTTPTDDAELRVSLVAGRTYRIQFKGSFSANGSATPDIKIKWVMSTGAVTELSSRSCQGPSLATADVTATTTRASTHAMATEVSYGCDGTSTNGMIIEEFIVACTSSGSLRLQWAQNTSNATSTTLTSSSYLIATPVDS